MNKKPKGWRNDSYRHSLARRGITTKFGPKYTASGVMMPSAGVQKWLEAQGFWSDLWGKAKEFGGKIKETAASIKERIRPSDPEVLAAKERLRVAKEQKKQAKLIAKQKKEQLSVAKEYEKAAKADVERSMVEERGMQLETEAAMDEPLPPEYGIQQSEVGGMISNISKTTHKPAPEEMFDVTEEMYESPDADAIIATSENKEKLITYANEVEYNINQLKAERNNLAKEFKEVERHQYTELKNNKKANQEKLKRKIELLKTTGMEEHKVEAKIRDIKEYYLHEIKKQEIDYDEIKKQHRVDVQHVDGIIHDLKRLHRQVDKRVKSMTASGVKK